MSIPKDCTKCHSCNSCNSAMYTKGCLYFPPKEVAVKKKFSLGRFLVSFFA